MASKRLQFETLQMFTQCCCSLSVTFNKTWQGAKETTQHNTYQLPDIARYTYLQPRSNYGAEDTKTEIWIFNQKLEGLKSWHVIFHIFLRGICKLWLRSKQIIFHIILDSSLFALSVEQKKISKSLSTTETSRSVVNFSIIFLKNVPLQANQWTFFLSISRIAKGIILRGEPKKIK